MVKDRRKAQAELEAAAKAQLVTFKADLDASWAEKLEALNSAPDANFDAAFLSAQMVVHQSAMELFAFCAEKGGEGPLRTHAQAQYPALHMHFLKAHAGARE